MEYNDILKEANIEALEAMKLPKKQDYFEIVIDFKKLPKPDFSVSENIRLKEFAPILKGLELCKNKPCLYFFEITNTSINTKEIIKTYQYLNVENKAALRKSINFDSKYLYVGKSQKNIQHRMKVHFGYKNTTENGLQLLHWAKPLLTEIMLHVYCFDETLGFLLPLYEKKFDNQLKPLIGYL
ncbi:MAG: hypothetical protein Tsb0033_18890 [Winogradskyella sp.]